MKVRTLKPALSTLAPRIHAPRHMRHINETGRSWYKSRRWKKLRMFVFERDLFTCQRPECRRIEANTSLLVGHHWKKHGGNREKFFNPDYVQTVCKKCHDSIIASEERAEHLVGDWD